MKKTHRISCMFVKNYGVDFFVGFGVLDEPLN